MGSWRDWPTPDVVVADAAPALRTLNYTDLGLAYGKNGKSLGLGTKGIDLIHNEANPELLPQLEAIAAAVVQLHRAL